MCKFCNDPNNLAALERWLNRNAYGVFLTTCPVCGIDLKVARYLKSIEEDLDEMWCDVREQILASVEETVEIDGETLTLERIPSDPKKPAPKPMDMTFDLDKVNIDRELELIKQTQIAEIMQAAEIVREEKNKKGEE